MKYIGIDYGSKKLGLASSDDEGKMAFPMMIIKNEGKEKVLKEILDILKEMKINKIVIGESVNERGLPNEIAKEARSLAFDLENISGGVEVFFEKEWYSTVEARRFDDRRDADDSAAAIILQRHLDKINRKSILEMGGEENEDEEEYN